jgi:hypothetical protein
MRAMFTFVRNRILYFFLQCTEDIPRFQITSYSCNLNAHGQILVSSVAVMQIGIQRVHWVRRRIVVSVGFGVGRHSRWPAARMWVDLECIIRYAGCSNQGRSRRKRCCKSFMQ